MTTSNDDDIRDLLALLSGQRKPPSNGINSTTNKCRTLPDNGNLPGSSTSSSSRRAVQQPLPPLESTTDDVDILAVLQTPTIPRVVKYQRRSDQLLDHARDKKELRPQSGKRPLRSKPNLTHRKTLRRWYRSSPPWPNSLARPRQSALLRSLRDRRWP